MYRVGRKRAPPPSVQVSANLHPDSQKPSITITDLKSGNDRVARTAADQTATAVWGPPAASTHRSITPCLDRQVFATRPNLIAEINTLFGNIARCPDALSGPDRSNGFHDIIIVWTAAF